MRIARLTKWENTIGLVIASLFMNATCSLADEGTSSASNARSAIDEGAELLQKGDYKGALTKYNLAVSAAPNDGRAYGVRGELRGLLGDYAGAEADCTKSISLLNLSQNLTPQSSTVFGWRGSARMQLHNYRGATDDFTKIVGVDPHNALAYHSRGLTRLASGDNKGAISDFTQTLNLTTKQVDTSKALGGTQFKVSDTYMARGMARLKSSDSKNADADFSQVIKLAPSAEAFQARSEARSQFGDVAGAKSDHAAAEKLKKQLN